MGETEGKPGSSGLCGSRRGTFGGMPGRTRNRALRDHSAASEFGGDPGLVQPYPHTPTPAERLAGVAREADDMSQEAPDWDPGQIVQR